MLRTAYVDDQVAARDFSTGDVVRKTDFRGFFPSPYAGRVVYSDPKTGTVQVQWPWGAEQEEPTELIRDTSGAVMPPEDLDQSYSTWELARYFSDKATEKADAKWRKSLSSDARRDPSLALRVARRYEDMTKPVWRAACRCHHAGLDEIAAFALLSRRFSGQFGTDAVRLTVSNLYEAGRRPTVALYWKEHGRRYKVTKREKKSGQLQCPRCSAVGMKNRTYRKNKKVLTCTACGFAISPKDLLWGDDRDQAEPVAAPAPTAIPEPTAVASRATAATSYGRNILRLARTLSGVDPLLAYELRSGIRRLAVVNPGLVTWEKNLEEMVATLKSLDQELGQALEDYETAEEYAKFFEGGIAEEEELKKILERTGQLGKVASGGRSAGFADFWKKMKKKLDWALDDEDESRTMQGPDYVLDDEAIDDFVEGSREWADASEYVEEEFKENRDFFKAAHGVLDQMEKVRDKPSRDAIRALRDSLPEIIKKGEEILRGAREHLKVSPIELEDHDISTGVVPEDESDVEQVSQEEIEYEDDGGKGDSFDFAVRHYVDMLRDSLDDPEKTKKYLRELYREVGPELERAASAPDEARARARRVVFSCLVRTARERPSTRGYLLPLLREIADR